LRFQLEWGKHEKHLLRQQEAGQQVAALDNAPELYEWLICYWKAFSDLSSTRNMSQVGASAILISEIGSWLDFNGIYEHESRSDYMYYIRQLDSEFLNYTSEKLSQQHEKSKKDISAAKAKRR